MASAKVFFLMLAVASSTVPIQSTTVCNKKTKTKKTQVDLDIIKLTDDKQDLKPLHAGGKQAIGTKEDLIVIVDSDHKM